YTASSILPLPFCEPTEKISQSSHSESTNVTVEKAQVLTEVFIPPFTLPFLCIHPFCIVMAVRPAEL
ncbi:hypothetical protein DVA76_18735, partial [Acinetobacter baumannii]